MNPSVKVVGAPGYVDEWSGTLIEYVLSVDGGEEIAVVQDSTGHWHIVPSQYVKEE